MHRFQKLIDLIASPRRYRFGGHASGYQYLNDWPGGPAINVIREFDDTTFIAESVPSLTPAPPGRVGQVEQQLGVTFPPDLRAFYENWDGGVMMMLYEYRLLSLDELIEERDRFSEPDTPPKIIRFCDLDDGNYMAVRLGHHGGDVVYADAGTDDDELFDPQRDEYRTDDSFEAWLKRIIDTDGWPITPGGDDETCYHARA